MTEQFEKPNDGSDSKNKSKRLGKASMIWLAIIVVITLAVVMTPAIIKAQLEKNLSAVLDGPVQIQSVSLNPFKGHFQLFGLVSEGQLSVEMLSVDIALMPLTQSIVQVELIEVAGLLLSVDVQNDGVSIAGVSLLESSNTSDPSEAANTPDVVSEPDAPWHLVLQELSLNDGRIEVDYLGVRHDLSLLSASVSDFDSKDPKAIAFKSSLQLNEAPVTLNGVLGLNIGLDQTMTLSSLIADLLVSELQLETYSSFYPDTIDSLQGTLEVSQEIQIESSEDALSVNFGGYIQLSDFSEARASANVIRQTGSNTLSVRDGQLVEFSTQSQIVGDGLKAVAYVVLDKIDWRGDFFWQNSQTLRVEGDLDLSNIDYAVSPGADFVKVDSVKVGSLKLLLQEDMEDVRFLANEVNVTGADVLLERSVSGELAFATEASPSGTDVVRQDSEAKAVESVFQVGIAKLRLEKSKIEFIDRSVEPFVDLALNDMQLAIDNFSLTEMFQFDFTADHQTASNLQALLNIKGELGLGEQNGVLDMSLKEFEIHEVAPYMGSGVKSGRLQLDSNIKMQKGHMQVSNKVHIKNVKIDDRAQAGGDQMSLSTALFLLKDKNDVVELNVPFDTDFNDFEIGFADIMQTAMLKAAQTTAMAYAQYALQPYGSLLLAKDIFGAVTKPKFEPIRFATAQTTLSDKDSKYVTKLGEFLVQKPELTVTVCGFSQTSELLQLKAQQQQIVEPVVEPAIEPVSVQPSAEDLAMLKTLAETRSHTIRDLLLAAGVAGERLYACTAAVESQARSPSQLTADKKAKQPRVELAL